MNPLSIPNRLRDRVTKRAEARCDYCLLPARYAFYSHEIDHVVPRKHGGQTLDTNLALACVRCNRHKGSELGSLDPDTGEFAFFNPRVQHWSDHFVLDGSCVVPLSPEGRVTVANRIFSKNGGKP